MTVQLGDVLYQERSRQGLSAAALARRAQVSESSVRKIESGQRVPSASVVVAIASVLGLPPETWGRPYARAQCSSLELCEAARMVLTLAAPRAARSLLRSALRHCKQDDRHRHQGDVYRLLGNTYFMMGRFERSEKFYEATEATFSRGLASDNLARATYNHAVVLNKLGRPIPALNKAEEASTLARKSHDREILGRAHSLSGYILLQLGSYCESSVDYSNAVSLLTGTASLFDAMLGTAVTRWAMGEREEALVLLDAASAHVATPQQARKIHHDRGVIYRQLGHVERALSEIHLSTADTATADALLAASLAEEALCQVLLGDHTAAGRALDEFFISQALASVEPQDAVTCYLLARMLGRPWHAPSLPVNWHEDYEGRLAATLAVTGRQASTPAN